MNEIAQNFLQAYASGHEAEGGWRFAKALQQARLDYSDAGLSRLDQLLTAIRERAKLTPADLQESLPGQNFCSLIAYHLIEVVRRRTDANIDWHDRASALHALPAGTQLSEQPFARLVAIFPDQMAAFMPLGWIESCVFGDGQQATAQEYVASLIAEIERDGPPVWWTGMHAVGRIASYQMMMAADGGSVLPTMLRSTAPMTWVALMMGLPGEDIDEALTCGVRSLDGNPEGASWQVLAYDGLLDMDQERVDAVMVLLKTYGKSRLQLKLAFPYRPAKASRAFEILDPTLREANIDSDKVLMLGGAMQRGIQSIKWAFGTTWDQLRKVDRHDEAAPSDKLLHLENPPDSFWENQAFIKTGAQRVEVCYGENTFIYRRYYSTSLTNRSDRPIRVLKFGGFAKEGKSFQLRNFSGNWFTAQDFIDWYEVDATGWIQPGETVCDDSNYGGDNDGFWAYWCCNDANERFMAMAHYSASLTGGKVYSLDERQPGLPADPYSPCPPGITKRLKGFTANCLDIGRQHAGREIGFDEDGVRWLDDVIEEQRLGDPANRLGLMQVFGAFLGECIIRKCGGVWARCDEALCVRTDEGATFPFNKVAKQFDNGRAGGDSVLGMYRLLGAFRRNPPNERQQGFAALFKSRPDCQFLVAETGRGTEKWARVTHIEGHCVTIEPEWLAGLGTRPTVSLMLDQIDRFRVMDAQGKVIDLDRVAIALATPSLAPSIASASPVIASPADESMAHAIQRLRLVFSAKSKALNNLSLQTVKAVPPLWMKPQDPLFGFFEQQQLLLKEGSIFWAALVQANSLLFSPGDADCPAQLVWSDDPYFDARPQELRGIGRRIFKLKNTTPSNPEERKIAEQITDEVTRSLGWKLPPSLTDRNILSTTFMVYRKHIPKGVLGAGCFPILTHASTPFVMIVPFEFWPIELIILWKDGRL